MNASHGQVQLPLSNTRDNVHQRTQRLTVVGAILTLVVFLFLTAQWPQRDSNAERVTSIDNNSAAENAIPFDYFWAQFGSPAPAERISSLVMHPK